MSVKIFRDNNANAVFVAQGTVGAWPFNCLQAVGNGDNTVSIKNLAKKYPDDTDFFEISNALYTVFVKDTGASWGADETTVVNELNAIFSSSGSSANNAPQITSSLAVSLTTGSTLNYELTATNGVGYEWSNLPAGVTTVDGNARKLIGGSSLVTGTYNITAKAINYYGEDTETVVLTVANPAFADTKSIRFDSSQYMAATPSVSHPLYRASNGSGATDAWTISFWLKAGTATQQSQTVMSFGGSSKANDGAVWIKFDGSSGNNRIVLEYGTQYNQLKLITPASSVTANTWQHWVITYDGSSTGAASNSMSAYYGRFSVYKNGVAQTTTNSHLNYGYSGSVPATEFRVGRRVGSNGYLRSSYVDELALWGSDQSSNVAAIYNSGSTHNLSSLTSAPTHWWRMGDGDTYPTIVDNVGSLDLTMLNMTVGNIVTDTP